MSKDRSRARTLATEFVGRGDPTGWFEALYREVEGDETGVPWADLIPNPHLVDWHRRSGFTLGGKRALKVGCGLGDDAEYLAAAAAEVTAFDISETAIQWCRRRFPRSRVRYETADVLAPPPAWREAFDFVQESYTLQVLPPDVRAHALRNVAALVARGGTLLVICRGRDGGDPPGAMPWPLVPTELEPLAALGFAEQSFEDFVDDESPPVRRFRALYRRSA